MTVDAPAINPVTAVMLELSQCVCEKLATVGAGPTCWCGIYPGLEVSLEFCFECSDSACGMGWVRLAQVNPYAEFPTATVDLRCALPLAAAIELGAVRCVPILPDGELPDAATMSDVALLQAADMWALREAVLCCGNPNLALGFYTPHGPDGGCVGGFWTAYLGVD